MTGRSLAGRRGGNGQVQRDPRLLVLATLVLALLVVSLRSLATAALALTLALAFAAALGPPWPVLLRRLAALEALMIVVLLTLPFTVSGEPWLRLGPLVVTWEGLHRAALIALKANAVVLILLGLLGSLEPAVLGHALARLHVPDKLVHLLLLTVRQIGLLDDERRRLLRAMQARAFVPRSNRHTWVGYGNLIGMLLVRSLARARRVEAAMRARGFHGRFYLLDSQRWRRADTAWLIALMSLGAGLLALDRLS
jgi:cobalt/nickel transport system permease protein